MNVMVLILAGVCLFAVHLFRAPGAGKRVGAVAAFLGGLILAVVAVRVAVSAAGIGRTTDFDRVVNHAVETVDAAGSAPLIIFTGASYSRNALDDDRLTRQLRAEGYPHIVINLSLEAASLPEREAHLDAFLARIDRAPDLVFIEVAEAFDVRPAQFFNNSKFSARGIEQFDPRTTVWTLLGLSDGGCGGAGDCLKAVGLTGAHFGLNVLNVGLVSEGDAPQRAGQVAAYDPQWEPREVVSVEDRLAGLRAGPDFSPITGPKWIASLRALLHRRLEQNGVGEVGYYFPPVIDAHARAYMDGVCIGEFADALCLPPTDPKLLAALEDDVWFDASHLMVGGAHIYTDWLARQLVTSGALGAPHGPIYAEEVAAP